MNPLQYHAHPLLFDWVEVLLHPGAQSLARLPYLLAVSLLANLLWALALGWFLWRAERLRLTPLQCYLLALPATLLYLPLVATASRDVLQHGFELRHRWFLLFAIVISQQTLAAFYAFAVRFPRSLAALGLPAGFVTALFMLLVALPASLLLLGIEAWWGNP